MHIVPMFDWNDLRYFLEFTRAGSMLAAAKVLRVNQSTVRRRIAELETRLGQQLVVYDLTGYVLTQQGRDLLRSAEKVEEAVKAVENDAAAHHDNHSGRIRVTTTGGVAEGLRKTSLIDTFHARHRDLRLELMISDRTLDLSAGEADLAIRSGVPRDDSLVGRKITDVNWGLYASKSYIQHHGAPRCPADIGRHVIVACHCACDEDPAGQWLRSVAPNAIVAASCETGAEQLRAVKTGVGIAPLLAHHGDGDLIRVMDIADLVTPYYLLMPKTMRHTPRIRAFADFVAAEIKTFRISISGAEADSI